MYYIRRGIANQIVQEIFCKFETIYINENKQLSCLSDDHKEDDLRTATSSMYPEYDKLVPKNRYDISH
jgi:hypothetical protein